MIICTYKKFFSKNGEEFQLCGAGIFKSSAKKAESTIEDWNKSGSRKNKSNCRWKYEIMDTRQPTLAELDDVNIRWIR